MRKLPSFFMYAIGAIFFALGMLSNIQLSAQSGIYGFVLYASNGGPGTTPPAGGYGVQIGSSITVNGGSIGSKTFVQTTGNATINSNIFSGGRVDITNSNVITGRITAANGDSLPGNTLQVGSSAMLGSDIDVYGNVLIGGGTVSGRVTIPPGYTYNGPDPVGGLFEEMPDLLIFTL